MNGATVDTSIWVIRSIGDLRTHLKLLRSDIPSLSKEIDDHRKWRRQSWMILSQAGDFAQIEPSESA
jgi:hypothetical protein